MAVSQLGTVLVVASSGIIFGYRVSAIWGGNRVVHLVIGFMYLFMISSWVRILLAVSSLYFMAHNTIMQVAVCSQFHAVGDKQTGFGANCRMDRTVKWAPLSFASSFAFDILILILTVWKLPDNRHERSPVGYIIFRDSLLYIFFTAATNLVVLSIESMGEPDGPINAAALPFSTLITTTMGCRLFLNLKLYHQREAERITPFISHSRSASGDDGEQRTTLLPSHDSPVPQQPFAGTPHRTHPPSKPLELKADTLKGNHERDRSEEKYIRRALPPVPAPRPPKPAPVPVRQSVPQDVYAQEQEFDAFLKDDELRLVGSPA